MNRVVAVAMSGGIDSLVAAWLLKRYAKQVIALHFTTGFETDKDTPDAVAGLAFRLNIPFHPVDLSSAFRKQVVDPFVRTYLSGETPNPCMACNTAIKFGALLTAARELGAEALATGHYARVRPDARHHCHLHKGADAAKDQSYFLGFLNQKILSAAVFPLGDMTKTEVRHLAAQEGLHPTHRQESQDICFVRNQTCAAFVATRANVAHGPGPILTLDGERIGTHPGIHGFTVGQRRGLNCPSSEPYYVVRIHPGENTLVVGRKTDLYADRVRVHRLNWLVARPDVPLRVTTRLRYRHQGATATVHLTDTDVATVRFDHPQKAPAPGQGAVFYQGDKVVGAGVITA